MNTLGWTPQSFISRSSSTALSHSELDSADRRNLARFLSRFEGAKHVPQKTTQDVDNDGYGSTSAIYFCK